MGRIMRWTALACLIAILLLSLLPSTVMFRTSLSKEMEHVVAYLGAGFIFTLGWREYGGRASLIILVMLVALGGGMEIFQYYAPGRTPSWSDFWASGLGALIGVGFAEVTFRAFGSQKIAVTRSRRV